MGTFLRSTLFETEFDGDKVSVRLKPLEQSDAMRVYAARVDQDKEKTVANTQPIFGEMLPRYIEEYKGPRAADGTEVTLDELTRFNCFAQLVHDIGWAIVRTGKLPDPKAPASPPGVPSAA